MYLSGKNIEYLSKEIDSQEEWFEDLWKTFHKTIAIKERTNKKCQQQFMPKKYWKNILEMENEI
jgi:probable DNA metabolism protein